LVENASDIVQTLNWDMGEEENIGRQAKLFVPLTDEETKIIDLLQNEEEADIDKLSIDTKIDHSKLASILLEMELKGMVRMIPGKRFILT
jgi:DNA processing protein